MLILLQTTIFVIEHFNLPQSPLHFVRFLISDQKNAISMCEFWLCTRFQVKKNGETFVDLLNKKGYELCMLLKCTHLAATCIVFFWNKFLSGKINLQMVSELYLLYIPTVHKNIWYKERFYVQTLFTCCTFIGNPLHI